MREYRLGEETRIFPTHRPVIAAALLSSAAAIGAS